MIRPPMGKKKTSSDQRSLCRGGRVDLITSTILCVSFFPFAGGGGGARTKHDNVENQDNQPENAAARAILPRVAGRGGGDVARGEGGRKSCEEEVEEEEEGGGHFGGGLGGVLVLVFWLMVDGGLFGGGGYS